MIQSSNPRRVTLQVAEPRVSRRGRPPLGSVRDAFAWHAEKVLAEGTEIIPAAEIEVASWPGREVHMVDFLIVAGGLRGRRIAVECSGSHSLRDHRSRRHRDARLVASGAVDVVYRINGTDPADVINDALLLIAAWEQLSGAGRYTPDAFSARGRFNLALLSSQEARETAVTPRQAAALVRYRKSAAPRRGRGRGGRHDGPPYLLVQRFDRRQPGAWAQITPPSPRTLISHAKSAA